MKLQLVLTLNNISSNEQVKDLNATQQHQLNLAMEAYYGKKINMETVFKDGCAADFWKIVDEDAGENPLYDYWEINVDSGTVFYTNTIRVTGVVMIQNSFDIMPGFESDPQVSTLVDLLAAAGRTEQKNKTQYTINSNGEIDDFTLPDSIPVDAKDWHKFLISQKISEKAVRKFYKSFNKNCWDLICEKTRLSEVFITEFSKKVNWNLISVCQKLTEDFIRQQQDNVNWEKISNFQSISENFMREFQTRLDWNSISAKSLTFDFIREFQDKLNWNSICVRQKITDDIVREFHSRFSKAGWGSVSRFQNISVKIISEFQSHIEWFSLSANPHLTDEHLEAFKDKLHWNELILHGPPLSEEIVKRFADFISMNPKFCKMNWTQILQNREKFSISEEFRNEILKKDCLNVS